VKDFLFGAVRFDRSSIPAELADTSCWPTIDASALDNKRRATFLARSEAIRLFVEDETVSLREIAKRTGVAQSGLYRLFARCVQPHVDGGIQGFRALVPYLHTSDYTRRVAVPVTADGRNAAGAFTQLLKRHPTLETWLCSQLRKRGQPIRSFDEVRRSIRRIHKLFIKGSSSISVGKF